MLLVNDTKPTELIIDGVSLDVLKCDEINVWGKPFALNVDQGTHTTVVVKRISSPNQHAEIGEITTGSLIYYGDIITINTLADDGYDVEIFTVNDNTWNTGDNLTVISSVTIVSSAISSASWHTVYTGSIAVYSEQNNSTYTESTVTIDGLKGGVRTRLSGTGYAYKTKTFNEVELDTSYTLLLSDQNGSLNPQYAKQPTEDNILPVKIPRDRNTGFIITKVEQYY